LPFADETVLRLVPDEGSMDVEVTFDVLYSETTFNQSVGLASLTQLYDYVLYDYVSEDVLPRFAQFFVPQ
jgi:hypothetical protein